MVTELAQHGSLQDLMKNNPDNILPLKMRIKTLLDASKGIQYLHSNDILHRDIKPDNFLVISLDENVQINVKLTDFGSSRNINALMTNLTFTKGIGTPMYMAPEVVNKQHYKKPADIYSFAITMYEIFGWTFAYPKIEFKFPWKIAEFVISGQRLEKTEKISDNQYQIVSKCWEHVPSDRPKIEEIIEMLNDEMKYLKENEEDSEEYEYEESEDNEEVESNENEEDDENDENENESKSKRKITN